MNKKKCQKCQKLLNKKYFYFFRNGHYDSYCKKCRNILHKDWLFKKFGETPLRRTDYGDKIRENDKIYQKNKRSFGLINKTEEYKIWRRKNPLAYRAQQLVNYNISMGKIKRQNCELCGEENAYAHHNNYNNPFDIRWLCPSCHKRFHLGILKVEKEKITI